MISDLLVTLVLIAIFIYGFSRPAVALCGIVYIDLYKPQGNSYSFLAGAPLSMVIAVFLFITMLMNFKKVTNPKSITYNILMLGFMIWITITTFRAQFPELAWLKYDVAIKTIFLAYFIPFVLKDRKSVELFVWFVAVCLGTLMFWAGVKTLAGGGGYGVDLVGKGGMWSEGSTLANHGITIIPLLVYLYKSSLLSNSRKLFKYLLLGLILCCFITLIGTQARSGIVCFVVLFAFYLKASKSKIKTLTFAIIIPLMLLPMAPNSWFDRMETMQGEGSIETETSALGRIVVWRWTLDYVSERPIFGGGFYAYRANAGQLDRYREGNEIAIETPHPKAFHSIIFEVLGGHGYGGLLIFLLIIFNTLLLNRKTTIRYGKLHWQGSLASSVNIALLIYCAGGLFVGIAFFPLIYYFYGLSIALYNLNDATQDISKKPILVNS
ncbi:putative O-glycosylation ligase, exosortase A system-associated [Paraglaciecola sp.]|uniref:putative O-glycosylation ligase, exosortase A system-associated n=1 Tax=Paraglaciecola sp. TaxID=1920173 RepID=UPI0030F3E5AE